MAVDSAACIGPEKVNSVVYARRTYNGVQRRVHIVRAEAALGRPLPAGAEVHHVDGDRANPDARLVICENSAYHGLLHLRARIVRKGGNPDSQQICCTCGLLKWFSEFADDRRRPNGKKARCRECRRGYGA